MNRRLFIASAGAALMMPKAYASIFQSSFKVINAGVGGNNTIDLLNRMETDCLSHKPKLVFLMIGTNDMNSMKHVPLERYRANLVKLADAILASGSQLVLMSILPFYEPYLFTRHPREFYGAEGPSGRRAAVNRTIEEVAKSKHALFFDIGRIIETIGKIGPQRDSLLTNTENGKSEDGVHPTPDGYRLMGALVYQFLCDHKLPKEQIVCFGDSITKGDGSIDRESYPAYLAKLLD